MGIHEKKMLGLSEKHDRNFLSSQFSYLHTSYAIIFILYRLILWSAIFALTNNVNFQGSS